jgi:REP element-mobilizing transposase RayT
MTKFKNTYRIESARLQNWDYGNNGAYFITICTKNRICFFGEGLHEKIQFNETGIIAEKIWFEIPKHFPFVELDQFVVMPNHIHGIIIINKTKLDFHSGIHVETQLIASLRESNATNATNTSNKFNANKSNASNSIHTKTTITSNNNGGFAGEMNPMFHENISRIIRWYKGRCSFEIRKITTDFGWQTRFYDHIIRNDWSYKNIQKYIENNPKNWLKKQIL